jgi:SET domain-containing protein
MYRPLPPYLTVKQSSVDGLGLFATEPIKNATILGISHVYDKFWENGYIRTPLGGFINHNSTPNCKTFKEGRYLYIIVNTDIKEGQEVTLKYTFYDPSR